MRSIRDVGLLKHHGRFPRETVDKMPIPGSEDGMSLVPTT